MRNQRWGKNWPGSEGEEVDFTGSLKDWNDNTKNAGISGKGRACANTKIGWKVIGYLQLRKEQNKHRLIPRLVVGHGDLSGTQELLVIIERCWKLWAHKSHPAGCLCRVGENRDPLSTLHFQKLLPVFTIILPYPEPWTMSLFLPFSLIPIEYIYIYLIVWIYIYNSLGIFIHVIIIEFFL